MTDEKVTTYVLRDWSSASKMKNMLHKDWRISVDVLFINEEEERKNNGYKLTVYNKKTNEVILAFYIDYGDIDRFTFTTQEALEVLNNSGFYCMFELFPYDIPENVVEILKGLQALGYKYILRGRHRNFPDVETVLSHRADIYAFKEVVKPLWWQHPLERVRDLVADKKINLADWSFLDVDIHIPIDKLLEDSQYDPNLFKEIK